MPGHPAQTTVEKKQKNVQYHLMESSEAWAISLVVNCPQIVVSHFLGTPPANGYRWTKPCSFTTGELHLLLLLLLLHTCSIRCRYCCRPSVLQGGASNSPRRGGWRTVGRGKPSLLTWAHVTQMLPNPFSFQCWLDPPAIFSDSQNPESFWI